MTEETAKQPVVTDTKAPAQPGAAGTDAPDTGGDDLDKLLSQFDAEAKPSAAAAPSKPEPGATDPALKSVLDRVESKLGELNAVTYRSDMAQTIKDVRGDLDPELFDDELVESWLDGQARKDPRLGRAWAERNANPAAFEKVKTQLGKELAKKLGKLPDKQVTEDRAAVAHAVRGASTRTPVDQPADYASMGNGDFASDVEKKWGYRPAIG